MINKKNNRMPLKFVLINWIAWFLIISFFTFTFWLFGAFFSTKLEIALIGSVLLYYIILK